MSSYVFIYISPLKDNWNSLKQFAVHNIKRKSFHFISFHLIWSLFQAKPIVSVVALLCLLASILITRLEIKVVLDVVVVVVVVVSLKW